MFTKQEKGQIRQIIQMPQWRIIEQLVNDKIAKIKSDSIVGDTEWDTVKAALINEGQERGIRSLLQDIYLNSQTDDTP